MLKIRKGADRPNQKKSLSKAKSINLEIEQKKDLKTMVYFAQKLTDNIKLLLVNVECALKLAQNLTQYHIKRLLNICHLSKSDFIFLMVKICIFFLKPKKKNLCPNTMY